MTVREPPPLVTYDRTRRWGGLTRATDAAFITALAIIGGFYVLLILALVFADGWFLYFNTNGEHGFGRLVAPFISVMNSPDIRFALWLSLVSCFIAAVLSVLVAIPLGYLLSRYNFWGKQLIDAILDVPIVLPPLVIGLSLLILFQTAPGKAIEALSTRWLGWGLTWLGVPLLIAVLVFIAARLLVRLAFDDELHVAAKRLMLWALPVLAGGCGVLVIASIPSREFNEPALLTFFNRHTTGITYAVPSVIIAQFAVACAFSVRTMRVTFDQISPRSEQVAMTLGCTRAQAFTRVVLPEAWRGILTAGTLAWARSLGEFGPILVFSGATRQRTEVLSTTVFLELSVGNINAAVAISLIMIFVALLVLMLVRLLGASPFSRGV